MDHWQLGSKYDWSLNKMNQEIKTNRLSVYLIKDEYADHKKILKDHEKLKSKQIKDVGTLYYGETYQRQPSWIENFFEGALDEINLFSASSKAILIVDLEIKADKKRTFAIPFGFGWTMLNLGVWEERFGLKTTLNIIDPNHLRRIDKKSMSAMPKDTSEQLSRAGMAMDFGINIEQDLIRSITARTLEENNRRFGQTVTGKDSFSVSTKVNLSNIREFLMTCYEKYLSDSYKENFAWIDQISEVKDLKLEEKLKNQLLQNIQNKDFSKTWMAIPEIINWEDVDGFTYDSHTSTDRKDDIDFNGFIESLSEEEQKELTFETLKNKEVYCFGKSTGELKYHWRIYNCIYSEISLNKEGNTYLLSNGKWYEIEKEFLKEINNDYSELKQIQSTLSLPKYLHKSENDYNEKITESNNDWYCMDRKNINHGGGHSKIEFCDIFTKSKQIIHVKRYAGSSVLSHLFSQGVISGELFLADRKFREKVNAKLPDSHKLTDTATKPRAEEYEVIFAVIKSSEGDLDIPFFSKVSLRNAKRILNTFGYKVSLQKIDEDSSISKSRKKATKTNPKTKFPAKPQGNSSLKPLRTLP